MPLDPSNPNFPSDWRDPTATRLSLLGRLGDWEDQRSWRRFFETYGRLLFLWGIKAGLSEAEAEEAMQNTVVAVAKAMRGEQFERRGPGAFKAWLYGVARHRILDQFRGRGRALAAAAAEAESEPAEGELERLWDAEWVGHRVRRAADLTRQRVSAKQFQIFDLYALREWPVEEVRETLNVSRAQVYMAKLRVGAVFKEMLAQADE